MHVNSRQAHASLPWALRITLAVACLTLLYVGMVPTATLPIPLALLDRRVFLVAGALTAFVLAGSGFIRHRWLFATNLLYYGVVLGLFIVGRLQTQWLWIAVDPNGRHEFTTPYPGSKIYHRFRPDFDAIYGVDELGWRRTPDPAPSRGEVFVLGCSYTQGIGVSDEETYPFRLGAEYWKRFKVSNRGYPYGGTILAAKLLRERLTQSPHPVAVLYGWIQDHEYRNTRSAEGADWSTELLLEFRPDPNLSIFSFRGSAVTHERTGDDERYRFSEIISAGLIDRMRQSCETAKIPFIVCAFQMARPRPIDRVPDLLAKRGTKVLDLRGVGGFYPNDGHPLPSWHAEVASQIARSPEMAFLTALSEASSGYGK